MIFPTYYSQAARNMYILFLAHCIQAGYTLSRLLYSGSEECGGTLFPAYCIQAINSARVHSFMPIYKLNVTAMSVGVHTFLRILNRTLWSTYHTGTH